MINTVNRNSLYQLLSLLVVVSVFIGLVFIPVSKLAAQSATHGEQQPIDMMLVVDNSCSMFPQEEIVGLNCSWFGSDPNYLRITGAHLFIARLGFAETQEKDYQIGAISFGEASPQILPLRPLINNEARNGLAADVTNPQPQVETRIIPALEAAYYQLEQGAERKAGNLPAIVLLTDGRPFPEQGQSNADIERLVAAHPNVPVFIMLLKSNTNQDQGFDSYIQFWQGLQGKYQNVRSYRVNSATEIEETYNDIVARLQNSNPSPRYTLVSGTPLNVYINKYVQRLVLTIVHSDAARKGVVAITDSNGNPVVVDASDNSIVSRFEGPDNQVEVISIGRERLDQAPRDTNWTITSDTPVSVFLDYLGAYEIEIMSPAYSLTALTNQLLALDRQPPAQPLPIRFKLVDKQQQVVGEIQSISGQVLLPDGSSKELRVPSTITPDGDGIYEIIYDFAAEYPAIVNTSGRFMFSLQAGDANNSTTDKRIPVARKDLLVEVGRGVYLANITSDPADCRDEGKMLINVTLGDLDTVNRDSIQVKAIGLGQEIELILGDGDIYTGSLDAVCSAMLSATACSETANESIRIRLAAQDINGVALPVSERTLSLRAVGPDCTPTPLPTATPMPTPTPTPLPNQDSDRLPDVQDSCVTQAEWQRFPYWNGCPPPWWAYLLAGLVGLGVLALLALYLLPLLWITFVSKPADAYILVCRDGKQEGRLRSVRSVGYEVRRSVVTIGSKGHIRVAGMSKELQVRRRGKEAIIVEGKSTQTVRDIPAQISDGNIVVKYGRDQSKMKC